MSYCSGKYNCFSGLQTPPSAACLIQSGLSKLLCSLPSSHMLRCFFQDKELVYRPSACNTILFSLCLNNSSLFFSHICIIASKKTAYPLPLVQGLPVASLLAVCISLFMWIFDLLPPLLTKACISQDRHWVSFGLTSVSPEHIAPAAQKRGKVLNIHLLTPCLSKCFEE